MIRKIFSPELSVAEQLKQLGFLRLFYLITEISVAVLGQFQLNIALSWPLIWSFVLLHLLFSGFYSLLGLRKPDSSSLMLFQSILVDILIFSALLYLSGGATNGAVTILLLPVATAAALLRWRLSLALAVVAIIGYSVLMFYYVPLQTNVHMHHMAQGFSNHLIVMWFTFIFSCLLLVWFIGQQAHAVREKHQKLSALREGQLRDEQLIAIATFAANAAHDLATPLSSIGLLCDELKHEEGKEGLDILIEQVQQCREIVQSISHRAILNKSSIRQQENVYQYFDRLVNRWLVTRPEIELKSVLDEALENQAFTPDAGLESALINILDNAADASIDNDSMAIELTVSYEDDHMVKIAIKDFGVGISDELMRSLGNEPVASTNQGLGLGQFLANATIGRSGGNVWRSQGGQGTQTLVHLPLSGEFE